MALKLPPDMVALRRKLLKDSGFVDIESDVREAKTGSSLWHAPEHDPATAEYWRAAQAWLEDGRFRCPYHRRIWAIHVATGGSALVIGGVLIGKERIYSNGTARKKIRNILAKIRDDMTGKRRPRHRPRNPHSKSQSGMLATARLSERGAEALFSVCDIEGVNKSDALEAAIIVYSTYCIQKGRRR